MNIKTVAKYFISIDDGTFNNNSSTRLNIYLHMAQNLYIAKTGEKLFKERLYAADNGAENPCVRQSYHKWKSNKQQNFNIPSETKIFLNNVYNILKNADMKDLIQISKEDREWQEKHCSHGKMDSLRHASEYKTQYADAVKYMEKMNG